MYLMRKKLFTLFLNFITSEIKMNNCLLCCHPIVRKGSKSVGTSMWETVLKILRATESEPLVDVSGFEKCQLCEICLNFANRSCELIRLITELQSELNDLGGKLHSFFEKSIILEKQAEESCGDDERRLWVEARRSLKTCIGNAGIEQIIEVCPIWEEGIALSQSTQVRDRAPESNEDYANAFLHFGRISENESTDTSGEEVFEHAKFSSTGAETLAQFDHAEETRKQTQFRTFTVKGFVLKDLEICVERLTEDFILEATSRGSPPLTAVSDVESSDEDADPDYNYASDQSANNSPVDQNADSGKIQNDENGRYRCALCGDRFHTYKLFLEHRKEKHPADGTPLSCNICGKMYTLRRSFKTHMYRHSKGLSCKTCGKKYYKEDELQRHEKDHSEGRQSRKPWCEICKLNFSSGRGLYKHRQSVHKASKSGQFASSNCGKACDTATHLNTEMQIHADDQYCCDLCNRCFPYLKNLQHHKRRMHPGGAISKTGPRECKTCTNRFDTGVALLDHIKTCSSSQGPDGSHECQVCGKMISGRKRLLQHMIWHRPGKHVCEVCGKRFVERPAFRRHLATHTKEKLYTCEMCGKHVVLLKAHLQLCQEKRASEDEKTFKCSNCDKSFFLQESLNDHQRNHSNEARFECEVCHQCFKLKCFLVEHRRRAHFPEERLPCTMCSETFVLPKDLNWHMQYEHFGKRDKCSICGYEGKSKRAFHLHMRMHRVGRRYECELCDKKFLKSTHLNRHKKIHEKD